MCAVFLVAKSTAVFGDCGAVKWTVCGLSTFLSEQQSSGECALRLLVACPCF